MPLVNPLFGHSGKPTFADARRDLEGTVVRSAAGVMRAGVFPDHLNPLVTGQSSMRVAIADFRAVQNRGGAVFLANVGADTSVTIAAAPSANRRIDLVYVTMRSSTLGDTADTPIFGVVQGVASATPVTPSLPANLSTAIPLATVEIPAGATTTLSAGVIITQVYQYTAMAGGTVVVRSLAELAAWQPGNGGTAYCLQDGINYSRRSGEWKPAGGGYQEIHYASGNTNVNAGSLLLEANRTDLTPGDVLEIRLSTVSVAGTAGAVATLSLAFTNDGTAITSTSPVLGGKVVRSPTLPSGGIVTSMPGLTVRYTVTASGKLRLAGKCTGTIYGPDVYALSIGRVS